jgi:hypothetical protein
MEAYQQRVIDEKSDLDLKILKLDDFRHGSIYPTLPEEERSRLTRQYCHMKDYSDVLGERIESFKEK